MITRLITVCALAMPALAHADKTYTDGKGGSWDCKKDHTVNINIGKGKFTLAGPCKTVNINGDGNRVTIAATGDLNISGAANKVDAGTVDAITIQGTDNRVTWKKGDSADHPAIKTDGKGNKVSKR